MTRERLLAQTMVQLADNLVDEFDVVDVLTTLSDRCVEVFEVTAAGIMLVGPDGVLRLVTSSSEAMRMVELFELQSEEGPCLDCYRTGEPVACIDLDDDARWPLFTPIARDGGFRAVNAIPLRLRRNVIGALNLFHIERTSMSDDDVAAAQALADVATIAILQQNAANVYVVNQQLAVALESRIVIEQAKGMLAARQSISMEEAFRMLRSHARNHNQRLTDVAAAVTVGSVSPADLDALRT
jgi:GAF domain-containing protein